VPEFHPLTTEHIRAYVPLQVRPRWRRWRYAWTVYRIARTQFASRRVAWSQFWLAMTWIPRAR